MVMKQLILFMTFHLRLAPNASLQLRRAISVQAAWNKLLEKRAIAPSAARLCWMVRLEKLLEILD